MAIINLLREELNQLISRQEAAEQELSTLPKGYISKKAIKGREYYYLQHREGKAVKSQLIKKTALENTLSLLRRKAQLKQDLKELAREQKQVRKMLQLEEKRQARQKPLHSPRVPKLLREK